MRRNKKSLIAIGLVACMTMATTVQAFAAPRGDDVEATTPVGGAEDTASKGGASITSDNGNDFYTEGDDDATPKATDVGGADINVWAKVIDSSTKIYKVDLAWGAMKFEFNSGSGQWDTENHEYTGGGGTAEWTVTDYLDGTNNKIDVTNHSNNAIDAEFAYAMESQAFNDAASNDAVAGHFFKTNTEAMAGALILTGTYNGGTETAAVPDQLAGNKISLATADAYNSSATDPTDDTDNQLAGARTDSVHFAFSGTPDLGRGAALQNFAKVGVITVTVAPNNEAPLNRPAFTP